MIVIDTNVLSELVRPAPDRAVVDWVDAQYSSDVAITAITAGEVRAGVARMPSGRRRNQVSELMESLLADTFFGSIVPFDAECTFAYSEIVSVRGGLGRPISFPDAQIAAICRSRRSSLATRNTKDFEGIDVDLINPWSA